ncbi:MAG: formylglycine-generating enzyme family protein [Candidatus Binatia bacterium]
MGAGLVCENYYQQSPVIDPQGPESGTYRVLRGGSWYVGAGFLRVSYRVGYDPGYRYVRVGFRCAV